MIRRRNAILLALGLLAPLALVDAPAGAVDQDLVVSSVAGPPGTEVTVSSASCVSDEDTDASIEVSLYVGTEPDQQIAAFAQGYEGEATFTIPDWVDADQPAVIASRCTSFTEYDDQTFDYDPVAFDIEPGAGTPVQVRTFSRTELLGGQALTVSGSCGPTLGNGFVSGIVGSGPDQTGESFDVVAGQGYAETDPDGSFEMELYLTNAHLSLEAMMDGDEIAAFGVEESPLDVPAGDYTAFVYCSTDSDDASLQFLEPQLITITGDAPTGDIDLTAAENTSKVTVAGTCTAGDVVGEFESLSVEDVMTGFDPSADAARTNRFAVARSGAVRAGDGADSATAHRAAVANLVRSEGGIARALADDGYLEFEGTPEADGSWQASDDAGFDNGVVIALATCGDPFADGFAYDPQGVSIAVVEAPPTTVPPTTAPAPAPANAVSGTPTYAG